MRKMRSVLLGQSEPVDATHRVYSYRTIAFTASLALLIGGFLFVALFIGRYPLSYIDESFLNYPAISFLKGHGFHYVVSSEAPYGKTLWAYHGPFYPHLQVFVFWLFGISQQASRLPNLLAGYSAACLMAYLLWRERYRFASLIFALLWLGDRSTQELQYARMDGLALLSVVISFIMLNLFYRESNSRRAFCVAFFSATAVAFHPATGLFLILCASLLCFISYKRRCLLRIFLSYGAGLAAVTFLVLVCVHFHPIEALQQFQWHLHYLSATTLKTKWINLLWVIRWSKWFFIALVGFTAFAALPIALMELGKLRRDTIDCKSFLKLSLALFAVAGLVCLTGKAIYPCYIIYFSIWPIALLAAEAEQLLLRGQTLKLGIAAAAIILLAWLPSAAWNAMRTREAFLYRNELKHDYILGQLKQSLPANAKVSGNPLIYILAEEANLDFTPAPWFAEHSHVPQNAWLLLSESEYANPAYFSETDVHGRAVVFCSNAFPGAKTLTFDVCLLRPLVQ
jgi:hypothetical protein